MDSSTHGKIKFLPHHEQQSLCTTRPLYRQGRKLTAVKVYTVNDESVHLLIHGVPSIGLLSEVSVLCERYGRIKPVKLVDQYSPNQEEFTNIYHVQFERIQSARFAKKILDNRSFFGGVLHVCYAPELETVHETKLKLVNRKREIAKRSRCSSNNEINKSSNIVTCDMDEESFKTSDEDKFSLGINLESNFNNSAVPGPTMCFPSPSQETSLILKSLPFIGPTMSSSDFNISLATAPREINSPDSSEAQNAEKDKDLKMLNAVNQNFSKPQKRPFLGFITETESHDVSQQIKCSEFPAAQDAKRKKVSKTWEAVNKNFSNPLKRPYSGFIINTQPLDSSFVSKQTCHPESTTQNVKKKPTAVKKNTRKWSHSGTNNNAQSLGQPVIQHVYNPKPSTSQEVGKTVTFNSNTTSNNSLSPLKPPVVGPIRFIPRSISIKKK